MPRLQLSEIEVELIEKFRRKNAEALAHNRANEQLYIAFMDLFTKWSGQGGLPDDWRDQMKDLKNALKEDVR